MSDFDAFLTRRTLLRATSASAAVAALGAVTLESPAAASPAPAPGGLPVDSTASVPPIQTAGTRRLFRELDEKIRAAMDQYTIPGVAVGVLYQGMEYVKGYGVTNVNYPVPVDGDTVFRVASNTKTFTGTALMRLVESGKVDLDAPVRRYLPDFRTSDPAVTEQVTVRHLVNHTAGWLGDDFQDTGPGDDAAAKYTAGAARLPQLTQPGTVFQYNNAAVEVAGRVIEAVTGQTYEAAVRQLLIDPLGLAHSRFFVDEIIGFNVAAAHDVVDGKPIVKPEYFAVPRSLNAAGGLVSSANDLLRWARFHLGDGTVPGGDVRLLTHQTLLDMRSNPGPGGTLFVELDGVGINWTLRPSSEGVRIVQHGGDLPGQHSGFLMVPDRGFVLVLLTNSQGGPNLVDELFVDDWALRRFAGVSNLPAVPRKLSQRELAPYEGLYTQQEVLATGELVSGQVELKADDGQLVAVAEGQTLLRAAFYRPDFVVFVGSDGKPRAGRADFVRGAGGRVDWLRVGGRLLRHETANPKIMSSGPAPRSGRRPVDPFRRATATR